MNVFACLVHEAPECAHDLLDNLGWLDPESVVLLYDGTGGTLTQQLELRSRPGVAVVSSPKVLAWGRLHDFAIDCMRFAVSELDFDTLTIVDSDQLLLRAGYTAYVQDFLGRHLGAGCLVSQPGAQPPATQIGPARAAWQEVDLWRPFLRRFPRGEETFPQWTFWPSTVFTAAAVSDLLGLWQDEDLQRILARSRIWASEEIILPSLVALTGHEMVANPCSYDLVQYRVRYSPDQLEAAMGRTDTFWVHPVPRQIGDPLRTLVRDRHSGYRSSFAPAGTGLASQPRRLPRTLDLIGQMSSVDGWLSPAEADLLSAAAVRAMSELPAPHLVVEVGSYCGRATVVLASVARAVRPESKVLTIDPHDGTQGERNRPVRGHLDSHSRLVAALDRFGLGDNVRPVVASPLDVERPEAISLLVIDRLHDYASVASDFAHFQGRLVPGGLVAFHDYADYFPGVKAWVDQLGASGAYTLVDRVETMAVLEKIDELPLGAVGELIGAAPGREDEIALMALAAARARRECGPGEILSAGEIDQLLAPALAAVARSGLTSTPENRVDDSRIPGDAVLAVVGGGTDQPEQVVEMLNRLCVGGYAVFVTPPARAGANLAGNAVRSLIFEHALSAGDAVAIRRVSPSTFVIQQTRHPPSRHIPLVSCVMPTYQRRRFLPEAIRNWQAQDYPNLELIVVDDGEDKVGDLIPDDDRIRYVRLDGRASIGAKRNVACEAASGDLVINWDDDDWSAPWRVGYQVETFLGQNVDVSGLATIYFCDPSTDRAWRYEYPAGRRAWVHDATFCYRRSYWEANRFPDASHGIDVAYLWQGKPRRVGTLDDPSFYVGMVHSANTSRKNVHDSWWHPQPVGEIASLMGPTWDCYRSLATAGAL